MANSLQDIKLLITGINTSTPSRDRQINWRAEIIINNLLLLYFGFSLGGNFNSFEIKQRTTLHNQRLKIAAVTLGEICHKCITILEITESPEKPKIIRKIQTRQNKHSLSPDEKSEQ